jgi:hypothetical protein
VPNGVTHPGYHAGNWQTHAAPRTNRSAIPQAPPADTWKRFCWLLSWRKDLQPSISNGGCTRCTARFSQSVPRGVRLRGKIAQQKKNPGAGGKSMDDTRRVLARLAPADAK